MLARLRKAMEEKDEGFTLIELLVVIIIIGILAAIAIPVFLNQRNKGYEAQAKSDVRNAQSQIETFQIDNASYPTEISFGDGGTAPSATTVYNIKKSKDVTGMKYGAITGATGSYCVQATSANGQTFAFDSSGGGGVEKKICNGNPSAVS